MVVAEKKHNNSWRYACFGVWGLVLFETKSQTPKELLNSIVMLASQYNIKSIQETLKANLLFLHIEKIDKWLDDKEEEDCIKGLEKKMEEFLIFENL